MKKILFLALAPIVAATMCSCGHNSPSSPEQEMDSTLCQFSNIKMEKMFSYYDEERDTLYFDNTFTPSTLTTHSQPFGPKLSMASLAPNSSRPCSAP